MSESKPRPVKVESYPRIFVDDAQMIGPVLSISEAAKVFFVRSDHWIRYQEKQGRFVQEDGEDVGGRRNDIGVRHYYLYDIERMVEALLYHQAISPQKAVRIYAVLKALLDLHQFEEIEKGSAEE
jgi:hypothetical protein